jgi:hypothetical protein
MQTDVHRTYPGAGISPADVLAAYAACDLARLSDAELCDGVAGLLAAPKRAPADSFVLHAPLELLARAGLLPFVRPAMRERARQRIVWLGAAYEAAGPAVEEPRPRSYADRGTAVADLRRAIDAGELDDADDAAAWLAAALTPSELARALADDLVPRLGAAGHGSILLYQLRRVAPRSRRAARGLRGLVRELAREPDWKLSWHRSRRRGVTPTRASTPASTDDLFERLRRPRSPGDPGSDFIHPTMSLVERSGLAAEVLDAPTRSLDVASASRALARVAALSMLQDDPTRAPYGWSHCLSMPQGVLGIADAASDPDAAIAVAATFVLGFRATLGKMDLDPAWRPERPARDHAPFTLDSPAEAAARVWYAAPDDVPAIVAALATRAAVHADAHLAKYTLACFDAASADPEAALLHLAAAAFLSAWWSRVPVEGDPLALG